VTQTDHKIRLAIAGNHRLIREFFCTAFAGDEQIEVVAQAEYKHLAADTAHEFKPDVVLLEIALSPADALTVVPQIREASAASKVLIVAPVLTEDDIHAFVKAGAWGCITTRHTSTSDLINAIKAVHAGEFWIERKITARILKGELHKDVQAYAGGQKPTDGLTKREIEVLYHLAKGLSNKQIATTLYISDKTVKSHINRIFKKLNINRRIEALLFAMKNGLLQQNNSES
jgi:DNA-binding NarL/FixJ family response regulator